MESASFRSLQSHVFELYARGEYRRALDLALSGEGQFPDQEGRIGFWIGCLHSRLGQLNSAVQVLRANLDRGHWWSEDRMLGDEDLAPLRDRPDFRAIVEACAARRQEAQRSARPDVLVQVPSETPPAEGYPMVMAFHGRHGQAREFLPYWEESTAQGWLLSLPTSSQVIGPDEFGWDDPGISERDAAWAYGRTCETNPVNSGRVVLAGFSQGGALAIRLALKGDVVPACEFLAVAPSAMPEPTEGMNRWFEAAATRGVRGLILTGERDYARARSAELRDRLVASGVPCELSILRDSGHEFPADFPRRLAYVLQSVARG